MSGGASVVDDASGHAHAAAGAMPDGPPGAITPCPAAVKGAKARAKAANPCAGQGMSSATSESSFRDGFKTLQSDWPKLTADERQQRLKKLTNAALAPSGTPEVGIQPLVGSTAAGSFDFPTWALQLGDEKLKSAAMSDADAKVFANDAFHETRHAEQWYLMAQKRAAAGKSAAEISDEMAIPISVAESAVKNPLSKGDVRQACADALYGSVYGDRAAHRSEVFRKLHQTHTELDAALAEQERVGADAKSTPAQSKAAQAHWDKIYASYKKAFDGYRALPEEADAWQAGDSLDRRW